MRYRQGYNRGPLEERESLCHSDPFFMEVNGEPGRNFVYGIFIDNPSETVLDSKFNNPKEMFAQLREQGVKCSTNITPIISNRNAENYSTSAG